MVIAVVDDLLFSSKIRAVAQAAGTAVTFARSRDAAVSAAGDGNTSLVIVDLEGRSVRISDDQGPRADTTYDKIAALAPVYRPDGRITAASS